MTHGLETWRYGSQFKWLRDGKGYSLSVLWKTSLPVAFGNDCLSLTQSESEPLVNHPVVGLVY